MTLRRVFIVLSLVAASSFMAVPAQAQTGPGDAVADGNAGTVVMTRPFVRTVGPVVPCDTEGVRHASNALTSVTNVVTFTTSRSRCTLNPTGEIAEVRVTSGRFRFEVLRQYGGPSIRLASYAATCRAEPEGSRTYFSFAGLSGVPGPLPTPVPRNHKVTIPGGPGGKPWALVTFNEVHFPDPVDGSQTVHMMHIKLFPQGGPAAGDAYIGTVHCSPVS